LDRAAKKRVFYGSEQKVQWQNTADPSKNKLPMGFYFGLKQEWGLLF